MKRGDGQKVMRGKEASGRCRGGRAKGPGKAWTTVSEWGLNGLISRPADSPRYQLRREVMTKKRIAWLDPCFSTVAVRP